MDFEMLEANAAPCDNLVNTAPAPGWVLVQTPRVDNGKIVAVGPGTTYNEQVIMELENYEMDRLLISHGVNRSGWKPRLRENGIRRLRQVTSDTTTKVYREKLATLQSSLAKASSAGHQSTYSPQADEIQRQPSANTIQHTQGSPQEASVQPSRPRDSGYGVPASTPGHSNPTESRGAPTVPQNYTTPSDCSNPAAPTAAKLGSGLSQSIYASKHATIDCDSVPKPPVRVLFPTVPASSISVEKVDTTTPQVVDASLSIDETLVAAQPKSPGNGVKGFSLADSLPGSGPGEIHSSGNVVDIAAQIATVATHGPAFSTVQAFQAIQARILRRVDTQLLNATKLVASEHLSGICVRGGGSYSDVSLASQSLRGPQEIKEQLEEVLDQIGHYRRLVNESNRIMWEFVRQLDREGVAN